MRIHREVALEKLAQDLQNRSNRLIQNFYLNSFAVEDEQM